MDFTIQSYRALLEALIESQMPFQIRHDVDLLPKNSLRVAELESELNINAVYYFRIVPESFDSSIIKAISNLGHEIGYHYESLTTCNGDEDVAYQDFCRNLETLRKIVAIKKICMHGSPRSPWDSKDIWKKYDYHQLGIDYEPYLDTDFTDKLYLTDTGRMWDGYHVSVRDKIPKYQEQWDSMGLTFHSTFDIINQLRDINSPLRVSKKEILITTHPQRWNHFGIRYVSEYLLQSIKNRVKKHLVKYSENENNKNVF